MWYTMSYGRLVFVFFLTGCVSATNWHAPDDFIYTPISTDTFEIATWQKITNATAPIHIYIEGDGHSFNGRGMPTNDPTPHDTFLRDLATANTTPNVVYVARPCQYIMSPTCAQSDWTDGRFSPRVINSMAAVVKKIAASRPIILIGYSGGAMVSGLIIQNYPDLNVEKWITIAGVLNHSDWTEYFGDSPLSHSLNLDALPNVQQVHYAAESDKTVPIVLTYKWTGGANTIVVPNATHNSFDNLVLNFNMD